MSNQLGRISLTPCSSHAAYFLVLTKPDGLWSEATIRSAYRDRPQGRFVLLGALVASLASGRVHAVDVNFPAVAATVRASGEVSAVLADPAGLLLPQPGSAQDPTLHGAQLRVLDS